MKLRNVSTPEKNVREIEFVIDRDKFEKAVYNAYKANSHKVRIPGFRPGKAPKSIIEKMYGADFFYNDALNVILPDEYDAALEEAGIKPINYPEFDFDSNDEEGFLVKAKFYIRPELVLGQYKGLTAEKNVKATTEADVDDEIEKIRHRNSRMVEIIDRPAAMGDIVTIDYLGTVDSIPFDGGAASEQKLTLGSHHFIPGFEEQIVGKNIGDEFDVNVTFPEEYHSEELSGKDAVFACKLHKIEFEELPELDDEFAKDVSDFDTYAEYRADMKAKIEKRNEDIASNIAEEQLLDHLIAATEVDVPAPMIDSEVENEIHNYEARLAHQGISLDMYIKYTGTTIEQLKESTRPQAEKQVKLRLILEEIAKAENIEATPDDIENEYAELAKMYEMEIDQIKAAIAEDDLATDIKVRKAVDLVKSNAEITVVTPEEIAE